MKAQLYWMEHVNQQAWLLKSLIYDVLMPQLILDFQHDTLSWHQPTTRKQHDQKASNFQLRLRKCQRLQNWRLKLQHQKLPLQVLRLGLENRTQN